MCAGVLEPGITMFPCCTCQRRITCAALLPYFTTDVALERRYRDVGENRTTIPITDPEANVSFHLVAAEKSAQKATRLFAQ